MRILLLAPVETVNSAALARLQWPEPDASSTGPMTRSRSLPLSAKTCEDGKDKKRSLELQARGVRTELLGRGKMWLFTFIFLAPDLKYI